MVDIWKYANALPKLRITTTDGKEYYGKVIAVFDAEESGEEKDSLSLELEGGRIVSFYAEEIRAAKEE